MNLNEPATWFADPGADGNHFDLIELAVAQAMSTPHDQRHPRARILKSGATYGWDAIDAIGKLFEIHRNNSRRSGPDWRPGCSAVESEYGKVR